MKTPKRRLVAKKFVSEGDGWEILDSPQGATHFSLEEERRTEGEWYVIADFYEQHIAEELADANGWTIEYSRGSHEPFDV